MKVKAISTNSYKGDTFKRLDAEGRCVFGIYKNKGVWENDTYSDRYASITEAKQHAQRIVNNNFEYCK